MDIVSPPQTRSRSRSKTPFTSTMTERENNGKEAENGEQRNEKKRSPIRKEPTVQTIREEDESAQTPAKKSKRETRSSNVSPGEGSSGSKSQQQQQQTPSPVSISNVVKVTTTTSTTKVVSKGDTTATESLKKGTVNQREFNQGLEGSHKKISTPQNNKRTTGGKLSGNGDLSEHIAYKEYREAGEYWNKYPKTDYTYSKLSPHRREIAPGIIAMPNMSRKSLDKHAERVNQMALDNPDQASYIRARYESSRYAGRTSGRSLHYDSGDDEIDLTQFDRRKHIQVYRETIFRQIYTRIITTIITSWEFISRPFVRGGEKRSTFYATTQLSSSSQAEHRGLLRRLGSVISSSFLYVFQRIYLLIASILLVDTWLLQTKTEGGRHKKKFLWFLILLLPLLLLGVWSQSEEEQKSRILSVLPLTLGWLPSLSSSAPWSWTDYLPTVNLFASSSQGEPVNVAANIQQHLTAEEFERLLVHIDQYIDSAVGKRSQVSRDDLNLLVAQIVRQNIVTYRYEMTEMDIERIVTIILDRLKYDPVINQELIDKITLSVQDGFQGESPDEIVARILKSSHLSQLIDQRMRDHIVDTSKYDDLISKLTMEISKIKIDLSNQQNTDEDLKNTVESMKSHQEMLADQLYNFKLENDEKLNQLLNEIDVKIATLSEQQFVEIDRQIRRVLVQIFNVDQSSGQNIDESDLKNWIKNIFVAKEYLEARLSDLQRQFSGDVEVEIQRSAGILMQNITDTLRMEIMSMLAAKTSAVNQGSMNFSEDHVRKIVQEALSVYDADKTGLVDYALESAGGQILSTRCTESYHTKTAQISIFGIPLWYPSNTPRTAISPSVQPGNCWAFQGFPGFLVLKLNLPVLVTGFTMEHIPKALAPNGQIDSAPKGFSVWGLVDESDQDPLLFGKYVFEDNGRSLQYFPVQNLEISRPHQIVELRIESNHDNPNYTCLYRFRVHGTPQS
ncbi:uncharacterized protein DMENIID0001_116220 [Sergentomyia squamirostris]